MDRRQAAPPVGYMGVTGHSHMEDTTVLQEMSLLV